MITRDSLLSLEAYARQRNEFRAKLIEHKKRRNVHLGEHVLLQFEDELTIRYQVQEMLRIERIFEDAAPMRAALARGAGLSMGVDHPQYRVGVEVPADIRAALAADLA